MARSLSLNSQPPQSDVTVPDSPEGARFRQTGCCCTWLRIPQCGNEPKDGSENRGMTQSLLVEVQVSLAL